MPGPGAGSGNKKGATRTKGNLKPSSSSQAAQLLAAAGGGGLASGFIGFGSASGAAAFVPVSQVLEEEESGLEPTFRVTLRKLSKRDSVTKLKALHEFSTLCTDSEEEVVKAALPFWPKIYNKLALDVDHKVREETQNALCALVSKVRRSLAPQLKFIMGSWMLSQCDTYPTVASAAQQAFSTAFPPAKQTDAIIFCKDEIAEFLYENLIVQTASTLSDAKTCPADDMEMKYNRVLTSSLLAWRRLLEVLTESTQGSIPDILKKLLNNPKLWKFSKSTVISVKSALYSFISGVCQHQTEVAIKFSNKMAPLALHSIDESDCQPSDALWETVLSVVTYLPDCWSHVNVQKAFIPKLRKLLQTGCHGNAAMIGPDILPLLSKIPDNICGSRQKLLEEIFPNMKQGLSLDSVRNSPQECGALVKAFIECAQYSVKQSLNQTPPTDTIAKYLLFEQVLPLCEASLLDEHPALFKSPLNDMIGHLLVSLNQSNGSNSDVAKSFREEITKLFLDNISKLSVSIEESPLQERLSAFIQAIIVPKVSNIMEIKSISQKSVTFTDSDQDLSSKKTDVKVPVKTLNIDSEIKAIVTQICLSTFTLAKNGKSVACLGIFTDIITMYPDKDILKSLLKADLVQDVEMTQDEKHNTAPEFVLRVCVPWISQIQTATNDSMEFQITHLLDISMTLLTSMSKNEVEVALSNLQKSLDSTKLFQVLVNKCLVWRSLIPGVSHWLHNKEFGERLVTVAQSVCQKSLVAMETDKEELGLEWALITSVLSSSQEDKEAVLDQSIIEKILGVIEESLISLERSASSNKLETAIHFVTDVLLKFFCNLKGCLLVPSAERLLLTLFSLSLEQSLNISESCSTRLVESWQCGVKAIIQQKGGFLVEQGFLAMASQTITSQVRNVTSLHSLNKIYVTMEALVTTVRDNLPDNDLSDPTLQTLLEKLSTISTEYLPPVQILQYLSVSQELFPNDQINQSGNTLKSTTSLTGVIFPSLFSARLMLFSKTGEFHFVPPKSSGSSSSSDLSNEAINSPICDWHDKDIPKLHYLFYNLALCEVWMDANKMICKEMRRELKELGSITERLMASVNSDDTKSLVKLALHKSETDGWIWSKCLSKLLSVIENVQIEKKFNISPPDIVERYVSVTTSIVHTVQLIVPYLALDERVQLTEIMVARVISSELSEDTDINEISASLAVIRSLFFSFQKDFSTPELVSGLLEQLVTWRQESYLSLSRETHAESVLTFNVEVIRLLTRIVGTMPDILTASQWDYILCALIGWLQHVSDHENLLLSGKFSAQELCVCSCLLLVKVSECIQSKASSQNSPLPGNLLTEWEEFFSEGSFSNLLPIFIKLTRSSVYKEADGVHGVVVSAVCHAVSQCPKEQLLSLDLPTYLLADQDSNIPVSTQTLLNTLCPMLQIQCRGEQVAAYWLLNRVIGDIPAGDKVEDVTSLEEQDDPTRSPPASLMKVLVTATSAMEALLQDHTIEDYFIAPPHTEEFHTVLCYLMSWKLLLNFFSHVPSEVKPQYAGYLKETGVVHTLLTDIFRLMPDNPSLPASPGVNLRENMFEVVPKLSALDGGYKQEIPHVACSVYRSLLEIMPALARQWWKDQDRKRAAYVDKYSMKYVSLLLCSSEIQSVQGTDVNLENITVKARAASREVIATYTLEEVRTEMVIALPANYPLGNITVTSEKRVGVTAAQWEKWLLQLNIFLQHQNGNIFDGLKMWKRNIDKRFEGVEECTICYSVIHGTTLRLPRLQCRTCKKKFHSACLYKWFSTSHQSTCPLCRNLF